MSNLVTHETAVRNGIADYVVDLVDTAGPGEIRITTAAEALDLAVITFQATAFGGAAAGVATANTPMVDETNATAGTAAEFHVYNGTPTKLFSGTVGTSGEGINLSSLAIGAGDTVSLSSFTYTAPL